MRAKLARNLGLLHIAERRVKHHARVHNNAPRGSARRRRAGRYLVRWVARRNWLLGKRKYLTAAEHQWLRNKIRWLEKHKPEPVDGLATFDGHTVAAWFVPWLQRSREHGWTGSVVSGYRDPAYSEQLCFNMCGAPSCPGRCAGRASNHSGKDYPAGAVDVTDYSNFERIQFVIGSPLRNHLPVDPVHFSVSGY